MWSASTQYQEEVTVKKNFESLVIVMSDIFFLKYVGLK